MIEVEVKYVRLQFKNGNERYVYPYFKVSGHANVGETYRSIRACAGISCACLGMKDIILDQENITTEKGLFYYQNNSVAYKNAWKYDIRTHTALDMLLYQLYKCYELYTEQFSSFILREITKGDEQNMVETMKGKIVWKKPKEKHMGLPKIDL